jgi:hypothetical protein
MRFGYSTNQLREAFEAQFELRDGRYLYRRNQRGEPIPVKPEERERFIRLYIGRVRWILGGMTVAIVAFIALAAWWSVSIGNDLPDGSLFAGLIAISVVAIGAMYFVQGAPARELEGRSSVGRERSKEEMRAIFLAKITYGRLAGVAAAGVLIPMSQAAKTDIFSGWHRIWLIAGAGLVLLAAVQAFRKWIFENQ